MTDGIPRLVVDLPWLSSQLEGTTRAYTELGNTIQMLSARVMRASDDITLGSGSVGDPPPLILPMTDASVSKIESSLSVYDRQERTMSSALDKLRSLKIENFLGNEDPRGEAPEKTQPLPPVPDTAGAKNDAEEALKSTEKVAQEADSATDEAEERQSRLAKFVGKEAASVKKQLQSVLRKIPGGVATGFVGGLIGAMVLGYTERDRRRAEMSEMANLFEGSVDSLFSASSRRATRWFANWGERAQWQWGVGRKETQGAVKLMVDNGFRASDMLKTFDDGLGKVGKNVVTLALGIGKHFNFATAEAMGDITSLVRDYGMKLDDAAGFYTRLTAAGARSAIGVRNFTRIVMSAADPLSRMRVQAETSAVFAGKVIDFYSAHGLSERYAGKQAEGVVADLMTSFTKLDDQLKIVLARDMYQDQEADAVSLMLRFDDGLRRISKGDDDQFLENLIRSTVRTLKSKTSTSRSRGIYATSKLLNVKNRTAQLVWDAGEKLAEGGKLEDLSEKERKGLRKAFQTESERVSSLHRTRRELIRGMARIGEAILAILVDLVSVLMVGLKGEAQILLTPVSERQEVYHRIYAQQNKVFNTMAGSWEKLIGGFEIAGQALGGEFRETFGPLLDVLRDQAPVEAPMAPGYGGGMDVDEERVREDLIDEDPDILSSGDYDLDVDTDADVELDAAVPDQTERRGKVQKAVSSADKPQAGRKSRRRSPQKVRREARAKDRTMNSNVSESSDGISKPAVGKKGTTSSLIESRKRVSQNSSTRMGAR